MLSRQPHAECLEIHTLQFPYSVEHPHLVRQLHCCSLNAFSGSVADFFDLNFDFLSKTPDKSIFNSRKREFYNKNLHHLGEPT